MFNKFLVPPLVIFALILLSSCEKDPEVETKEPLYIVVDSVSTTSVFLRWTQSHSDKFQNYQIHYSKKQGFAPSSGTLYKTFSDRYTTRTTVDSLVANQPYYFRVRLIKSDATIFDSDEVPAIPK